MHRALYLLLLAGYLMVACRSGKKDTPANGGTTPQPVLTFGSGGGFTGAVTTYTLHGDGQLHRAKTFADQPELIAKLDRKLTAGFFKKAEDLLSRTGTFIHPGNQYFFVKLGAGDAQKAATWGAADYPAPAGLEAFYQELMQHTEVTH
jgi:hypothetical protein